jgi:ABC-type transport system involved in cytochrome c biogenesis permease subunit
MRAQNRSASERELLELLDAVILYQRLKNGFQPNTFLQLQTGGKPIDYDLAESLARHRTQLPAVTAALKAREHGQPFDEGTLTAMMEFLQPYETVARVGLPLAVPPADATAREGWANIGTALRDSLRTGEIAPPISHVAAIATAYMRNVPADFNRHVSDYQAWLATNGMESALHTSAAEIFYIRLQPSMKAAALYVAAFILCFAFWMTRATFLYRSALLLGGLALVLHTTDLSFRILMEGRPPLTSVYSSTIFVGWCAVMLGVAVEATRRNGVGILTSALVGITALIAARGVAVNGGAIEALRATLASNLWLTGHVGLVTLGYAATLLAGVVAAVYIVLGVFTRWLSTNAANELDRLVYRSLVAALVFTAAGTMMGGFWADRVWGRFWSWDPKESGALLIILWTIITLQLRWQQVAGQRAQITMAAAGLIVLTVSWFGVGMMSVGLHSYGFMPQQVGWLATLVAVQATVVSFGLIPLRYWRSRKTASETPLEHHTVANGPAVDVRTRHWTEIFKLHSQRSVTEPPSETN